MFDFLNMMGTYKSRAVARYEANGLKVDTARVTDGQYPIETAVSHKEVV